MVDVDRAVIARITLENEDFEILVDCEKALELKKGKSVSLNDILATEDIYKDVKKGQKASENEIKRLFGTEDKNKVTETIIKKGFIQLTAEVKRKEREERRKQVVNLIHINAIDPKTSLPHPIVRIENALEEAKVKIDENKSAEEQVESVIKELRPILPIKFEQKEISVKIPAQFAGQSYHILKEFGKLQKDEWQTDGSLLAVIEMPAGLIEEFTSKLNKLTHGDVIIK